MKYKQAMALILVLALTVGASACGVKPNGQKPGPDVPFGQAFADYEEVEVHVKPSIKPYKVEPGLANVENLGQFSFSEDALRLLEQNQFVVNSGGYGYAEFFSVYEGNRYEGIPNFITTDAMLHNYHLYFSHLLRTIEKEYLYDELRALTATLLKGAKKQSEELSGTPWAAAAMRNVAYLSVASALIGDVNSIDEAARGVVQKELALIDAHADTFAPSHVMNIGLEDLDSIEAYREDYTQYIPRSHYTTSEELKKYFRTMMWYGRLTFRAANEDETRSAALLSLLLSDEDAFSRWSNLYEPTNFFVGKSDDLGVVQYAEVLHDAFGEISSARQLSTKSDEWKAFYEAIKQLDPPKINSMPIFNEDIEPDRDEAITGFRVMGQRFTIDAQIFQKLIYRDVKENPQGQTRMLPKALDVPAAMGSGEALALLDEMGETEYEGYKENMQNMRKGIASLDLATRTQNLYWSWLHMLAPLTEAKGSGYPMFMQTKAWARKQLETYISSWTELKHDTVLYAKQAYAEMGGGLDEEVDDRGYVEPEPHVYGRLAALSDMTIRGLKSRGFLKPETEKALGILKTLALDLKTIAEKEFREEGLTDEEYDLIRSFGGQLEHLWLEAMSDKDIHSPSDAYENPAALVTDVATDPNGVVLQEATGWVADIYVIVPIDGKLRIANGAVFTHYEFMQPASDRLTDEAWQGMLRQDNVPKRPDWVEAYATRVNAW